MRRILSVMKNSTLNSNYKITLEQKNDARLGGVYFVAAAIVCGQYFETNAFSRTAAIRELKCEIRRALRYCDEAAD